ncbi:MAG: double-cubane-cluster-containing anaerobic reductase [Peptostreptococcaceae bacterium]|nr:double-cubane-cluster-containing anaerobic reductase [Peptostreptococcaceae bacterium]
MYELPAKFEEFAEARRNGFLKVKNLKEEGKNVVGIFCTFTPTEIIDASGAACVSLCASGNESIVDAEKDLPKNLCPLIKSSYGFAVTDSCPYTYFSDLIVGETTCDGKKKMFELLGEIKNVHVMQLPQNLNREYSWDVWREEGNILKEKLEEVTGKPITNEALREASKERNEYRKLLIELMELGKLEPPPMKGKEMATVLNGLTFEFDAQLRKNKVREMIDSTMSAYDAGERPVSKNAKRILITGCPMGGVIDKTIGVIDEEGGVVVCYENCGGIKNAYQMVDENSEDIMKAITDRYLQIGCSVMTPNDIRMNLLKDLIKEYKVDGVVDVILQACHTYNIETKSVKQLCEELGTAYIAIETDYSESDTGQLRTRLGAFIEMI